MLLIAAVIAGLILTLKDGVPWFAAATSGVIHTRGSRRQKVVRAEEPERFRSLLNQRLKGMVPGLICLGAATGWAAISFLSLALEAARAGVSGPMQ